MFSSASKSVSSGGYSVKQSLRFRSSASAYLNRTFGTPTGAQKGTFSFWLKRGQIATDQELMGAGASSYDQFQFQSDQIRLVLNAAADGNLKTTAIFRDPSAWYHVVLSVDTTQATAANRALIYVNGVSQALTITTNITQNVSPKLFSNVIHYIGCYAGGTTTNNLDGYMAEVNFIDGQALTPSSFGATNATTGVWQPARYTGSYGTNGFYLTFSNTTSPTTLGYDFSGNSNNWTPNNIVSSQTIDYSIGITTSGSSMDNSPTVIFNGSLASWWGCGQNPSYNGTAILATAIPTSGFTVEVAAFASGSAIAGVTLYSSAGASVYKAFSSTSSPYWQTFSAISDIKQIKLSQDGSGYGGMGIAAIRVNGVVIATLRNVDAMLDSPTNYDNGGNGVGNYAVLNPLDNSGITIADGNLTCNQTGADSMLRGTFGMSSGKWYWEATLGNTKANIGIAKANAALSSYLGSDANGWGYYSLAGTKVNSGTTTAYGATYTSGDVIGVAFDVDAGTLTFYKNNTSQGVAFTGLTSGPYFPAQGTSVSLQYFNFGQRPFQFSPPSGFKALNTFNLP